MVDLDLCPGNEEPLNKATIFLNRGLQLVKANSPEILTAGAVTGVVTTSYLVSKASFRAYRVILEDERVSGASDDPKQRLKENAKSVWKLYIPASISGVVTIGCIIGASHATGRRTAAAVTAYSLTEKAFAEYREKVVEQIGKGKEEKIRDTIAQEKVDKNPLGSKEVIILGSGQIMCCELYTGRYFRSDMEMLKRSLNELNSKIINTVFGVTLSDWYDIVGLNHTTNSDNLGWDSDKLMDLRFTTVLTDEGEPCLAFEYNYIKPVR